MAKIFCIYDDDHFVFAATTPNAAAHRLIDSRWVTGRTEYYDEKEKDYICLQDAAPDSYMGEWENWFIDQVEENGTEFLKNLDLRMREKELVGDVEDLLPRGRFG